MRKHQPNALLKKDGEGELYSSEASLVITQDEEWLWKCSRLEGAKERRQQSAAPDSAGRCT